MAEILKTFAFRGGGRFSTYPWNEWFDGKIRRLTPGEDFNISIASLRSAIHFAARERGLTVRTNTDAEGHLMIQAVPRNGVNGKKRR